MNTQKLKELARRATGGIWNAFINEKTNTFSIHTPDDARCGNIVDWMGFDGVDCSKKQKAHNARFIAASNPAAVIELIEWLEAAERERDELRAEIARRGDESGWIYVESEDLCNGSSGYVAQPLYTAAPPAVLPPEKPVVFGSDLCQDIENYGYNLALADTRQMGAQQQQKTFTVQGGSLKSDGDIWYRASSMVELLKSAGVGVKP